jgi:uncharacterized protein YjbJ (UPF0337 family)
MGAAHYSAVSLCVLRRGIAPKGTVMKSGTENQTKGKFDEVAGKIKRAAGEAFNNQSTANRGAAQEVKGHAEQAWGSVQQDANTPSRHTEPANTQGHQAAHDIREKITSTAQNVKERIENHTDQSGRSRS